MLVLTTSTIFIDRYEVTNRQFKVFVDAGATPKPEYWKKRSPTARRISLSIKPSTALRFHRTHGALPGGSFGRA